MRPVIYQLFPRIFANVNANLMPNGRIESNGCGKLNDINDAVLKSIKELGITHIWYTGVIEHAHDVDYTAHGIERHNPRVIKGRAGSPYAIVDYYDIDPDLAVDVDRRMDEFTELVERTKANGMEVIIDFVPNHVARQYKSDSAPTGIPDLGEADNSEMFFSPSNNFYYITRQQFAPVDVDMGLGQEDAYIEFPAKATGNDCFTAFPNRNDWYETVKINYGVDPANGSGHFDPIPDTWFKMLHILRFWVSKGIGGFRCDMAHMVPVCFWSWAIKQVKDAYPDILFIAELYDTGIYREYLDAGFDYLYDKVNLYDTLRGIRTADVSAAALTSCWQTTEGISSRMLNFLENHDEQRYASQFYASDPHKIVPELTAVATMSTGAVMIYNGQELGEPGMDSEGFSGRDGRTTIFDFWSMDTVRRWLGEGMLPSFKGLTDSERRLRNLYSHILRMVNNEPAICEGAFFDLMYVNYNSPGFNPHRHFVYLRTSKDKETILFFLNFDNKEASASVMIPAHAFSTLELPHGEFEATELLTGSRKVVTLMPDSYVNIDAAPNQAVILKITHRSKSARNFNDTDSTKHQKI